MKLLRRILLGLGALLVLAVAALYGISEWKLRSGPGPVAAKLAVPAAAQLGDGPRQLHVLGCLSCHGEGLRGDIFLDEPGVGKIYAPNLTLVAAKATDQQLEQAIRQGIGHDGRPLLIMPSEGYQFMTDAEVAAVIAAIRALPKGGEETPNASVGPKGRLGIALGKFHTAPELIRTYRASPLPNLGAGFSLGRHIVEVNCSECHGPDLRGQEVEPGVVSADLSIAGAYDQQQFRRLLHDGVAPGGKDIGIMGRVAKRDFKYLKPEESDAIHAYLTERARRLP